jgi:hypothetical protein
MPAFFISWKYESNGAVETGLHTRVGADKKVVEEAFIRQFLEDRRLPDGRVELVTVTNEVQREFLADMRPFATGGHDPATPGVFLASIFTRSGDASDFNGYILVGARDEDAKQYARENMEQIVERRPGAAYAHQTTAAKLCVAGLDLLLASARTRAEIAAAELNNGRQ